MITSSFSPALAILNPSDLYQTLPGLPEVCLITFSKTVLDHALARFPHQVAGVLPGLNGDKVLYQLRDGDFSFLLYMSPITAAGAGLTLEEMAQLSGARQFVLFGSCGALDSQLTEGRLIVPDVAFRDEGLSYHYVKAADSINVANADMVQTTIKRLGLPHVRGGVWTTDALFRETRGRMEAMKARGCIAVDMECAGLQALCDFRGYEYYTFFYTGDLLDAPAWEARILDSGSKEADHQLAAFLVALQLAKDIAVSYTDLNL